MPSSEDLTKNAKADGAKRLGYFRIAKDTLTDNYLIPVHPPQSLINASSNQNQ